ncbi:hypothetical protein MNBD_DELTA01-970 [hydrothermal vent metagenome]|uniref:Lipoprotein n=1 Tax=hydrothermal vent metagenome TaxID=652676 RepID=A0A3B0QW96_9ZZZZ
MKKTFLPLLAAALFLSYGCHATTLETVKYHTEDKGTFVGKVIHLPVTAYRSVVKGFKSEEDKDKDNDTLID